MLARYGIPLTEFSEFIEVALGGRVVSQVFDQGRSFDVTVKVNDLNRSEMERIGNLTLDAANGQKVPLNYVAELISSSGPNNINRENAQRKIVVSANVAGRDLRGVVNDIQRIVKDEVPCQKDTMSNMAVNSKTNNPHPVFCFSPRSSRC